MVIKKVVFYVMYKLLWNCNTYLDKFVGKLENCTHCHNLQGIFKIFKEWNNHYDYIHCPLLSFLEKLWQKRFKKDT